MSVLLLEDGVAVDWVVLLAGAVALGV